jgi:hypothetical protein
MDLDPPQLDWRQKPMRTAYTKSDRTTGRWIIFGILVVGFALAFACLHGCTLAQGEQIAKDHPSLTATTQAVENGLKVGDKAAAGVIVVGTDVQKAATVADDAGVPWAGLIKLLASVAVGAATVYLGHRSGAKTTTDAAVGLAAASTVPPPKA